jgi:hypothetical protein
MQAAHGIVMRGVRIHFDRGFPARYRGYSKAQRMPERGLESVPKSLLQFFDHII